MDKLITLDEASTISAVSVERLKLLADHGKINAGMYAGTLLLSQSDLPENREFTPEWKRFEHLRGIGIGVRQAAERYGVDSKTISRWVDRGLIRRLSGGLLRGQRLLIDECEVAYCCFIYKADPGRGKRTLK